MVPAPLLTVVVPYGGTPIFPLLLESLALQSADWTEMEIIVVASLDGENPESFKLILAPYLRVLPARVLELTLPQGRHPAPRLRNAGAAQARAARVAFIDSDCILDSAALQHHKTATGIWCGAIRELPASCLDQLNSSGSRRFSALWDMSLRDYRSKANQESVRRVGWDDCYSGNFSLATDVFRSVGGFDESGFRCHDMDLGYRLALQGTTFHYDPDCRAIHVEHPRSLSYRIEQHAGWVQLAQKYPEMAARAEEHAAATREGVTRMISLVQKRFRALTAGLPGHHCATVFVTRPGTSLETAMTKVRGLPHQTVVRPDSTEVRLRMHRDCWDFSLLVPACKVDAPPRWTIAIPAYNSRATLGRAIESVLRQTRQDFEIVIVDDASDDDTLAVAALYVGDGRLRILTHRHNQGLSATLNRALLAARGEVFLQLDSDDWLDRECLERLGTLFGSSDVVATYGDPKLHSRGGVRQQAGWQVERPADYFSYPYIQAPRAYLTSALRRVGGWSVADPWEGRYYEDRLQLSRVSTVGTVRYAGCVGYNVAERDDSLARGRPIESAAAKLAILSAESARQNGALTWTFDGEFLSARISEYTDRRPFRWSVIIPHADRWKYLEYALWSWSRSDLPESGEILVVDTGSTEVPGWDPESLDPRIRVVKCNQCCAGAARNRGASIARGELLFFSDADHIVSPNICATHERWHQASGDTLVCGNVFARRVFTVVGGRLPTHRRRALAELLRMRPPPAETLGRIVRGEEAVLFAADANVWESAQPYTYADRWSRNWARLLLELGPTMEGYPHRWLRVGAGCLSVPASVFHGVNGFDETLRSKEDWEFGIRAERLGYRALGAVDSVTLHQIHPVSPDRTAADKNGAERVRVCYPQVVSALERTAARYRPPGAESLFSTDGVSDCRPNGLDGASGAEAPVLALTFDDGPHATGTALLLDTLARKQARGTFFLLGARITENVPLCRRLVNEGHELAVHGWRHTHPHQISPKDAREFVRTAFDAVADVVGGAPRFFRPPYGVLTRSLQDACRELGLTVAGWHIAPPDWAGMAAIDMLPTLLERPPRGTVYLFHDGTGDPTETMVAVDWLLEYTKGHCEALTLSSYADRAECPELELRQPPNLNEWREHSVIDLIVTGKL